MSIMSPAAPTARRPMPDTLPMTEVAWRALDDELADLISATDGSLIGAPTGTDRERRVEHLRRLLGIAQVESTNCRAVVGRRVTIRETDGTEATYALVIPGDGDPMQGWLGADAPMGAALLGSQPGDRVEVNAPAGPRLLTVLEVA